MFYCRRLTSLQQTRLVSQDADRSRRSQSAPIDVIMTTQQRKCQRWHLLLQTSGFPRITGLGSWVDTVAVYVSESPRQGTKKEAGLDLLIMCRRGCQPGNNVRCPYCYPCSKRTKPLVCQHPEPEREPR